MRQTCPTVANLWETGRRLLGDGQCCKLSAVTAIGMWDIRQSRQLAYLFFLIVCLGWSLSPSSFRYSSLCGQNISSFLLSLLPITKGGQNPTSDLTQIYNIGSLNHRCRNRFPCKHVGACYIQLTRLLYCYLRVTDAKPMHVLNNSRCRCDSS